MKKILLILLAINYYSIVYAQNDLLFPLHDEFYWGSIEKHNSSIKEKLIKDFPNEFELFRQTNEPLDSCLIVIDFNDDGLDDVVCYGYNGAEEKNVTIFINNGKSFNKIFTDFSVVKRITYENKKISKIFIHDWGCCCEISAVDKVYKVNFDSILPKVELTYQLQYLHTTELPKEYINKPLKFSITNNDNNIRISPNIDDTSKLYYCGELRKGNSVGRIQKGSIGYVLSQKSDSSGSVWWYVAMKPEAIIKDSMFYESEGPPINYKLGWISNRFVKIIGD